MTDEDREPRALTRAERAVVAGVPVAVNLVRLGADALEPVRRTLEGIHARALTSSGAWLLPGILSPFLAGALAASYVQRPGSTTRLLVVRGGFLVGALAPALEELALSGSPIPAVLRLVAPVAAGIGTYLAMGALRQEPA